VAAPLQPAADQMAVAAAVAAEISNVLLPRSDPN